MTEAENMALYMVLLAGSFAAFLGSLIALFIGYMRMQNVRRCIASLVISALLFVGSTAYFVSHPTYYKYNDDWIEKHTLEEIQDRYGKFDLVQPGMRGYYIYTDASTSQWYYYCIYFSTEGQVLRIENECQTDG